MIPGITEINFPSYATLHQATVSLNEMGDRTITTQVRIDGDIVPDFDGWELEFRGERFVLPIKDPQAAKDNTTRNSLIDLTFYSWPIYELKRYFFMSLSQVQTGVAIPDQYEASVVMPVADFVTLFNNVLTYYFGSKIQISLYPVSHSSNPVAVEINYTYIWDVLQKFYELFGLRWRIDYNSQTDSYLIKVDYPSDSIDDHDFEYGYQGGLLRFERQVQDDNIANILLGRGGEKNLPYRYFKKTDAENPDWAADPDAIPELANIYFDRLRDANFRWYVRGWMHNPHRDTSGDATWDPGHVFPTYTISSSSPYYWAYQKGLTDTTFNPVEYVKDDDSIEKYGERWGALDDNDEIFPTIQGVSINPIGRVDEVVAVSEIVTDDVDAYAENAAIGTNVPGVKTVTHDFEAEETFDVSLLSEEITIPTGSTGNLGWTWMIPHDQGGNDYPVELIRLDTTQSSIVAVNVSTGTEYPNQAIPAGTYKIRVDIEVVNDSNESYNDVTFGLNSLVLTTSELDENAWKPTFDIWVKNIWQTTKGQNETDLEYALRVWRPILGDRLGNEAKIVFSDGFMSISQDYEFIIASYPEYDTSKTINGVPSEWKITLYKSTAEYDVTGLFIPNSTAGGKPVAGDHFFFTGIDMPFFYVQMAEEDLNEYKQYNLDGMADISPTWVVQIDKVRAHTLEDEDYDTMLADRLATGITVRTKDSRFTAGETLILYVQTLTFTWNEGYTVPDIEVVLSDKVVAVQGTVSRLQGEVQVIRTTYAKVSDLESAVRKVASPLFLKKTGERDTSSSPTAFASNVNSANFRQGDIAGKGWGFYQDNSKSLQPSESQSQSAPVQRMAKSRAVATKAAEPVRDANDTQKANPDSVLEIDKIIVRKELHVNTLVVNQISYIGGKQITSAAAIECTQVVETNDAYVCYFDQKQGTVKNLFAVNDIAMGQVFSADNAEVRYYRRIVTAVDENSITLAKSGGAGSGVPKKGDAIVQFGNTTNTDRQYVIIRDVIGGGYDQMLSGLDSVDATGEEYYFAGRKNNGGPTWFVGDHDGDYAEFKNNKLTIKADITLEAGSDLAVLIDSKAKVFTTKPTSYSAGDIWFIESGLSSNDMPSGCVAGDIAVATAGSSSYNKSHWVKKDRYTDDSGLNTFINGAYATFVSAIETQVDKKAETFYQSTDPATNWTTTALKDEHIGDLWYNTTADANGYTHTYVYKKSGNTYSWEEINGVPTAVFDVFDGKSSIYIARPTQGYQQNDLWILESEYTLSGSTYPAGTIVIATTTSASWNASHWIKKDRYTDDTALNTFITGDYATFVSAIETQVDQKAETFYQSTDPSTDWTTTALKDEHIGDIWYDTSTDSYGYTHTYIYKKSGNTYSWSAIEGVPSGVFDTIDGKADIYVSKPSSYSARDLWIIDPDTPSSDIPQNCQVGDIVISSASSSSYDKTHWTKKDRYTDDSAIDSFNYLKLALGNDLGTTEASGGLVLATFIGVKDSNSNVVAGMNSSDRLGADANYGRLMMFAGATGVNQLSSAKFRVYETGHVYAEDAEIHGDVMVGSATGRRVQLSSGNYGAMDFFDSAGNITTHIGNDYCSTISTFSAGTSGNSPYIPSSNGTSSPSDANKKIQADFTGSDDEVLLDQAKYYTSRYFQVTGDQSANILSGNLTVSLTGSAGIYQSDNYCSVYLTLYTNQNMTGQAYYLGQVSFYNEWGNKTLPVNVALPAGTYYIFLETSGYAHEEGRTGSRTYSVTITGGTFTVTPISQRLQIFANGLGYRYTSDQYAALLREASSYSASGNLAFEIRTGSSSNVVGMDIRTSGVKIYGPVRTLLGSTTSFNSSSNYSMTDIKNYSFIEIVARFNSNAEVVTMLMTRATWAETLSSRAVVLSTDSRYVITYRYSDTYFKVPNQNGCSYLGFYGIL